MRIATLDDDDAQTQAISRLLTDEGHVCWSFRAARPLISALRQETFDLLVLDWNLPDLTGVEVINWVRQNLEPPPPMLLLTARSAEEDVVAGLDAGADDYIVKPVQPAVLVARVNALLRRTYPAQGSGPIEQFADFSFNVPAKTVTINEEVVNLTAKEFTLALLLFRNTHRALSRSHILEAVWGRNPDLPTRTLDMHVSRVRTKLRLRPEHGFRLAPVYSYGYRLERLVDEAEEYAVS
ncbi:MAG: response regulator transcription factor [Caulobacteraceae bacterium]|nr:MAG: response regulator transcription factor [Caulobacteraceae bacterium]